LKLAPEAANGRLCIPGDEPNRIDYDGGDLKGIPEVVWRLDEAQKQSSPVTDE
jgi:hypothetical protein